jgi:hypothetical protein
MSIPLVRNNTKDAINTSIIAIKKNLERINTLLGLVDSSEPDLSGLATKQELEDTVTEINNTIDEVETSLQPVDTVTSGDMHSVTSNAVAQKFSALKTISRWRFSTGVQSVGALPVENDGGYNDNPNIYLDGKKFKFRGNARYLVIIHIIGETQGSGRLFFRVDGLDYVYGISYGTYAECDIVFPIEVNINTEIYVNLLESFSINGGGLAYSYIAFSQI